MTIHLNFKEELREQIEQDWAAWWAGELDRPLVTIQCLDPHEKEDIFARAPYFTTNLSPDMPADNIIDHYQIKLEAMHYFGDSLPHWGPDFGPGIIAGFLGSQVHTSPDTVWFDPLKKSQLEQLRPEYDPSNFWLQRMKQVTEAAVKSWENKVTISHADLGGNLDILAHLRSPQQLLTDLYDSPCEVDRLVEESTHLWLRYYDEFDDLIRPTGRGTNNWAHVWSPGRTYMLQCDFGFMISPSMFTRFALPDLETCCAALDHSFFHFHLDSKWQEPQLDILLSIQRLNGIQWAFVEGWSNPRKYLPVLKRIREKGKLCQPWGITPQAAITIVRELGGKGFLFTFDEESDFQPDQAESFLRELRIADLSY